MGAIAIRKEISEPRRGFGLDLATIASEVFEGVNSRLNDVHERLVDELPYIQHRVKFALSAGVQNDNNDKLRSVIVDDVVLRYSEMLSPLKSLDVLERLLRVGRVIESHPNAHKSQYLLEKYHVAQSVIAQCAEKRGFEYAYVK